MKRSFPSAQLPLGLEWQETSDFEHFIEGKNTEVCAMIKSVAQGRDDHNIYLWGQVATGKSHLLQAVCNFVSCLGLHGVYIPLRRHTELTPAIFEGSGNAVGSLC